MPYELTSVASCFHNMLEFTGTGRIDYARRVELLEAMLRISKEANTGGSRRSKPEALGSEDDAYTPERVDSLLEAGYSEICSGGAMIFTLPYDIVDELRTCELSPIRSVNMLSPDEDKGELEHLHLDTSVSVHLEKMRGEKTRLRRTARNEYSPAHGDLVCSMLPSQLSYQDIFSARKQAYFVVNNTTTPPNISIKIVDQMKLGDRFDQLPFRVYSLERVASTSSSMEHWWPFVIGELVVIYSEAAFTRGVHTWSPATTIYRKRHAQFDGSCCITASRGTTPCNSLYAHLRTEYTLQVRATQILVSSYLMGWLRVSAQKIFAISEGFFAEKASFNKLLTVLVDYVKMIDKYKATLTTDCSVTKHSTIGRKNALTHQALVGSLPLHVIELAKTHDFLIYPYCSLAANSPVPYIPSSVQSHSLRSLLGDTSDAYLSSQQCYFSTYNYAVDVSPVFCCGSLREGSAEEPKSSYNNFYNTVFDSTLQCGTLENESMMLAKNEAVPLESSSDVVQRFPTYETLHSYLFNRVGLLKASQASACVDTSATSMWSTLLEVAEPQLKRGRPRPSTSKRAKEHQRIVEATIDTAIHNIVYRELFGSPLKTCRLDDRCDYVLNYHYRKSLDGYFHFTCKQPNSYILPLGSSSEMQEQHCCIKFYTLINVVQRRYTQLSIHHPEIYTLLKTFHECRVPISLFSRILSCVSDSLRAYPFGGLFISLLCHMWLAYDITDELNCICTAVWSLFGHSVVEHHNPTSLSTVFSYACGNVVIERYFRYSIPWFQRPQTILEFLLLKIQPTKVSSDVYESLRDLFRFASVINRTRAWYG